LGVYIKCLNVEGHWKLYHVFECLFGLGLRIHGYIRPIHTFDSRNIRNICLN